MVRYPMIFAATIMSALAVGRAPAATPDFIAAAVADSNRPAADTERDANRKPAATLEFAGVKPGEQIAELLPGGGYFTRLFSKAVGGAGHIYALVPYPNVSVVIEPFSELKTPVPVDLVWTSQNYHDLHNFPGLDLGVFNQMVFEALKPGGIYLILDHAAAPGSGTSQTATLHRIDPKSVKQEVLAAGFVFVGSSDLLRQPSDPHTAKVFDPSIRGKTDQFILKFRKPGKP